MEEAFQMLNVIDETIGGSSKKIRKATASLDNAVIANDHRMAHGRLKFLLHNLGIRMWVFKETPLVVNMRPSQMFNLPLLREEVERMVASSSRSEDTERAYQHFRTLYDKAAEWQVELEGLPTVLFRGSHPLPGSLPERVPFMLGSKKM